MDTEKNLTDTNLELLSNRIEKVEDIQKQMILELEEQIEILEKQIANLVIGYAEAATLIETLVSTVLYEGDENKQLRFNRIVNDNRAKMLQVFQNDTQINSASN